MKIGYYTSNRHDWYIEILSVEPLKWRYSDAPFTYDDTTPSDTIKYLKADIRNKNNDGWKRDVRLNSPLWKVLNETR